MTCTALVMLKTVDVAGVDVVDTVVSDHVNMESRSAGLYVCVCVSVIPQQRRFPNVGLMLGQHL